MEVFLFPLINVSLFPKTTKPLNIFEPRYLTMVKEAVQNKTPIALGFIEDPSQVGPVQPGSLVNFVHPIAGYGYPQIIEERLNGTILIFLQGQGKVRLKQVLDRSAPYMICEAEIIAENLQVKEEHQSTLDLLRKILTKWIQNHIPDPGQRDVFLKSINEPEEVVGAFASYLVRDYDLQQMVMDFNDINEKIEFLFRLTQSNELTV